MAIAILIDFATKKCTASLVLEGQLPLCTNYSDFASDSVTAIGLLGTSSGTQWVILLYWVPPDSVLLRFCVTESDAELFPPGEAISDSCGNDPLTTHK